MRSPVRSFVADHLPAQAWAILVAVALGSPSGLVATWSDRLSLGPWLDPYFDKIIHFVLFAVLAGLAARSLRAFGAAGWRRPPARRPLSWAVLIAIAYGGAAELLQLRIGGRTAEWADFGADAAGALGAALVVAWWWRRRRTAPAPGPAPRPPAAGAAIAGGDGGRG